MTAPRKPHDMDEMRMRHDSIREPIHRRLDGAEIERLLEAALCVEAEPVKVELLHGERDRMIGEIVRLDGDKRSRLERQHDIYLAVRFRSAVARERQRMDGGVAEREGQARALRRLRGDTRVDQIESIEIIAREVARKLEAHERVDAAPAGYEAEHALEQQQARERRNAWNPEYRQIDEAAQRIVDEILKPRK